MNTYLDAITYSRAATGLVLANYIGNIGRIAACSAGASALTVPALTVALSQDDALYLFDGASSETMQVGSGGAALSATSIPLQSSTAYAHSGGVAYCTDGAQGSLGQVLFEASGWLEDLCYQPLWQATYTGEALSLPTMQASIDNQGGLTFRPMHFPLVSLSAMSIATGSATAVINYDPTEAQFDSLARLVTVPVLKPLNAGQQNLCSPSLSRGQKAMLTITYVAGFATGQLPRVVTRACLLLANELLGLTENPIGADSIAQGKRNVTFTLRGDPSGESLLIKQVRTLLTRYTVRMN